MKKQLLLMCSASMLAATTSFGQYNFTTFTAPYQELVTSTELAAGQAWDDPEFVLNFGFPFQIGGTTFTQCQQFGVGATLFFQESIDFFHLVTYNSDLIDGETIGASPSTISYATEGTAGNLICKLQYTDCAFFNEVQGNEPNSSSRVNFQIWFYQANGTIEFRFGTNTIVDGSIVHDIPGGPLIAIATDLDDQAGTLGYAIALKGNPTSPNDYLLGLDDEPEQLAGNPEDGRAYRFEPTTVGLNDAKKPNFNLYPSLAVEFIQVSGLEANAKPYRITDITGKSIRTGLISEGQRLDISTFPSGLYIFQLDGSSQAQKFVKK